MKRLLIGFVVSVMLLGFLTACGKPYTIYTVKEQNGGSKKMIAYNEVKRDWHPLVGSDETVVIPKNCEMSALDWKGNLDDEQCTVDHRHLEGPNQGQTEVVRHVHPSDTIGKKLIAGVWFLFAFIPNLFGTGGDSVQNNTQTNDIRASTVNPTPVVKK